MGAVSRRPARSNPVGDSQQPQLLYLSDEQLTILRPMLGFAGKAALLVWPPPPESAGLQKVLDVVQGMAGKLDAVVQNHGELREENTKLREGKAALAAMQAEGLLIFVHKIDAEAFKLLVAVLIHGDVAKAAEALELNLEQVRWDLRKWRAGGGVYRALAEMIHWRKGKQVTGMWQFNDALKNLTAGTDRESVLKEVLSGLMSMTEGNWQDVCGELRVELRKMGIQ